MIFLARAGALVLLFSVCGVAQLPEGAGKAETERLCQTCHDLQKAVSLRQDEAGWGATIAKMVEFGAKIGSDEMVAVVTYLAKAYPAEDLPALNINKARAIQMESRLSLKRSEAAAIVRYRKEHGDFASLEDLKKVPGIDFAKIEAKRDILAF
jgi:competence protein ComEA